MNERNAEGMNFMTKMENIKEILEVEKNIIICDSEVENRNFFTRRYRKNKIKKDIEGAEEVLRKWKEKRQNEEMI